MLCSWCGSGKAKWVCRIGIVLRPSCRGCLWRKRLAVSFDGYFLPRQAHLRRR